MVTTKPGRDGDSPPLSLYSSLERTGATDAAVQRIQDLILENRLRPGDPLPPERELAEMFGVGRNVVREALRILVQKGLVQVVAGRGTFVVEADISSVSESLRLLLRRGRVSLIQLSDTRLLIEPELAARAAQNATPENTRELREWLERLEATRGNADLHVEADLGFHKEIAQLADHAVLQAIMEAVSDVVLWSMRLGTKVPRAVAISDEWHRNIVDAIAAGDSDKARREMQEHIGFVAKYAQENLTGRRRGRKTGKGGLLAP